MIERLLGMAVGLVVAAAGVLLVVTDHDSAFVPLYFAMCLIGGFILGTYLVADRKVS